MKFKKNLEGEIAMTISIIDILFLNLLTLKIINQNAIEISWWIIFALLGISLFRKAISLVYIFIFATSENSKLKLNEKRFGIDINMLNLTTLVFINLKILGYINWSWILVFSPTIILAVLVFLFIAILKTVIINKKIKEINEKDWID